MSATFRVWDPEKKIDDVTFDDEKKAHRYRMSLQKKYGRVFRMDKYFSNGKGKSQESTDYIPITVYVRPGEEISFSRGMLFTCGVMDKQYLASKIVVSDTGSIVAVEKNEVPTKVELPG